MRREQVFKIAKYLPGFPTGRTFTSIQTRDHIIKTVLSILKHTSIHESKFSFWILPSPPQSLSSLVNQSLSHIFQYTTLYCHTISFIFLSFSFSCSSLSFQSYLGKDDLWINYGPGIPLAFFLLCSLVGWAH